MCRLGFIYIKKNENEDIKKVARTILITSISHYYYSNNDGVGIAFTKDNEIKVVKSTNLIHVIHYLTIENPFEYSNLVVFHTRRATSGSVDYTDTHPFLNEDKNLALCHNGIVNNYIELKQGLSKEHKFISNNDSEVILHVFEEFLKGNKRAFNSLNAYGTFLVLDNKNNLFLCSGNGFKIYQNDNFIFGFSDSDIVNKFLKNAKEIEIESNTLYKFSNGKFKKIAKIEMSISSYCYAYKNGWERREFSTELENFLCSKFNLPFTDVWIRFNESLTKVYVEIDSHVKNFSEVKKFFGLSNHGAVIMKIKTLEKFFLRLCNNEEEKGKFKKYLTKLRRKEVL